MTEINPVIPITEDEVDPFILEKIEACFASTGGEFGKKDWAVVTEYKFTIGPYKGPPVIDQIFVQASAIEIGGKNRGRYNAQHCIYANRSAIGEWRSALADNLLAKAMP